MDSVSQHQGDHALEEGCSSQFFHEQFRDEQPSHHSHSAAAVNGENGRLRSQVEFLQHETDKLQRLKHQPSSEVSKWIHKVQQQANGAPEILQTLEEELPPQNRHRSPEVERRGMIVWFRDLVELANNPPASRPTPATFGQPNELDIHPIAYNTRE
jgi:hypothetical protein